MVPCCTCNGRNAICKQCVCACSGRPCSSCLPLKTDRCVNQLCAGGTSAYVPSDILMVSSNKNDDNCSDSTAHMLSGTNCASDPRYVLDTSNTCANDDSLPVTPSSICTPLASPSLDGSPGGISCVLCGKAVKTVAALWQHINLVYISRGCFPPLLSFNILIVLCSNSSCRFAYSIRWSTCQHSLGGSCICGACLVDPSSLPDLVPSTLVSPCVSSCSGPTNFSCLGPLLPFQLFHQFVTSPPRKYQLPFRQQLAVKFPQIIISLRREYLTPL